MLNDSWNRLPDARIRMREGGVPLLLKALNKDRLGMLFADRPRIRYDDDGIMISISVNAGTSGSLEALGIDIFIPVAGDRAGQRQQEEKEEKGVDSSSKEVIPSENQNTVGITGINARGVRSEVGTDDEPRSSDVGAIHTQTNQTGFNFDYNSTCANRQ